MTNKQRVAGKCRRRAVFFLIKTEDTKAVLAESENDEIGVYEIDEIS